MKVDVLLGLQWGDEGKGKVVDAITPKYDVIARFQGGPNAGHSLEFNNVKHVLHTIPSGIFHADKLNYIGNGVVIDPLTFQKEILALDKIGIDARKTVFISKKAHLILPTHKVMDAALEHAKGTGKIGSTLRGIGPTYTDKIGRNGLRVGDILCGNFMEKYTELMKKHDDIIGHYKYAYKLSDYDQGWLESIEFLKQFELIDIEQSMNNLLLSGKNCLAEGAQGTLLDIDFGTYPFVTSSNTVTAGACTGLGVAPNKIGDVIGIFKAYCTRVGSGPFPTELNDETGEKIRQLGHEVGATTGRKRRCGWLDMVALKYACIINGVTELVMTKADVLSGFENIKVCTAYHIDGKRYDYFPYDVNCEIIPEYIEFKGWKEDITGVKKAEDLPQSLKKYIDYIEKELQVPIKIISVGPNRTETIFK